MQHSANKHPRKTCLAQLCYITPALNYTKYSFCIIGYIFSGVKNIDFPLLNLILINRNNRIQLLYNGYFLANGWNLAYELMYLLFNRFA